MNIKQFALGGFTHIKDDELLTRGITVLHAMKNNSSFAEPNPPLAELQQKYDDFKEKLAMARRKGSPYDTAAKNESGKDLRLMLKQLAFYVSQVAEGDLQVLLSSGFALSAYPQAEEIPDMVKGIVLKDGKQSGQARLDFKRGKNVLLFEYRYAQTLDEEGQPDWGTPLKTTSSRNNILAALVPYERCYVQVRAVNGAGTTAWSEAVSHVVR